MGRITPSFRQLFLQWLHHVHHRKGSLFRRLPDTADRDAFDALVRDAWAPETAAMAEANIHPVIDIVNLMAEVNIKAELERLTRHLETLQKQVDEEH